MSTLLRKAILASVFTTFAYACPAQWKILNASDSSWINQNLTDKGPITSLKPGEYVELTDGKRVSERISGPINNLWEHIDHNAKVLFRAVNRISTQRAITQSPANYAQLDPWQDDAYCYNSSVDLQLARQDAEFLLDINFSSGKTRKTVRWRAEEVTLAWPTEIPVADGQQYQLALGQQARLLRLHQVPEAALLSKEDMALLLCAKGCARQAELLKHGCE